MKITFLASFCGLVSLTHAQTVSLPANDFPRDQTAATYISPDSLVTFTTSNTFSGNGDFLGDSGPGAGANLVDAFNAGEELTLALDPSAQLTGFRFRWTEATVTIRGFESDPGASLEDVIEDKRTGATPSSSWDDANKILTLNVPWDAGAGRVVTLTNPSTSVGATLVFSFAGRQATFTTFNYEEQANPLPEPLVFYSLDEGTVEGTTVSDLSPNGHSATLVPSEEATLVPVEGLFDEALRFAGGDDPDGVVTISSGVIPSGNTARTFSLWFNQQAEAVQNKLFGYGAAAAGRALDVSLEGGGIRIRHFGGNVTYGSGLDFSAANAGWHHVAVRVNDDATTFQDVDVFLNGNLLPISAQAGGGAEVTLDTAASIFGFGTSATPGGELGFDGLIDEFRAYDSALSPANIRELAELPPVPTIVRFQALPQNRVPSGSDVTLAWEVENSTSLILNPGNIDVTGQTSTVVNPTAKTSYTLTATDEDLNEDSAQVNLSVGDEPFPNVVIFFLDDFGWADWEQNGAATGSVFYETPHMNRMASEGLYFPNGYASTPVCSPTRGALMTGQAPAFNKLTEWITGGGDANRSVREAEWVQRLPATSVNWARTFADCGYRSLHIGKWHLGSGTEPAADPINHGFQLNIGGNQFGTPPGPERYFASANGFSGLPNMGPDIAPPNSYLTDVLTEQAVAQIRDAASSDSAFAMFLSHFAVHTPIQAPAATVAKYQAKLDNNPGMDWQGQDNPTYAAMIEHVDNSLGAILDTLEDPDGNPETDDSIADNTLVIFTADNGGLLGVTSNRPLRHGKGGTYEGGIREPWVFWKPGSISPGINPEPIVTHDIFPTILGQAGVANPAGHVINGQDLSPLLAGQSFEREKPLTFHYPHWSPQGGEPYSAIRRGNWKLIYTYANQGWSLYNLADNIGETNNLVASEVDRHEVMSWLLANDLEELEANYPRNLNTLAEEPPIPLVTPAEDADGDGQNDLEEAIQGTDREDATSFFAPQPFFDGGDVFFSFVERDNRRYSLEASETLAANSWAVIDTEVPLIDTDGPFSRRFYRIRTEFP